MDGANDHVTRFRATCGDCAKLVPQRILVSVFLMCRYPNWDRYYRRATLDEDELDPGEVSDISAAGRAHVRPQPWVLVSNERFNHKSVTKRIEEAFRSNGTLAEFAKIIESTPGNSRDGDGGNICDRIFLTRLYLAIYMPDIHINCIRELSKACSVVLNQETKKVLTQYLRTNKNIDMNAVVGLLRATNQH